MKVSNRRNETLVYAAVWLVAIVVYLIDLMRVRAQLDMPLVNAALFGQIAGTLLPYILLFIVHNYLLIPRLLLRGDSKVYALLTFCSLMLLWAFQFVDYFYLKGFPPHHLGIPQPEHHGPTRLLPLPLVLDFMYGLVVVGCNLAVALMFQWYDEKLEKEKLTKAHSESALINLKAQISPHFYMNMLNNIHGMIEIDPERAQKIVLDMSQLMRYMLYESSKPRISLTQEISFLSKYIELMKTRFDPSRVDIKYRFPDEASIADITLPPLLFLVFVENAFKHGISYRVKSFISIEIEADDECVLFRCVNSNHASSATGRDDSASSGIGLVNISRRLSLLYGEQAVLTIDDTAQTYTVTLTLPRYEH
ncbi:MAG: histidine kinase [Muribaculaceae bacterium]|nr:histidine kinase [Muribaculaceae bacterium]